MSYETTRIREIRAAQQRVIEDFVRTYNPDLPSVILLPGGMGSQLDQSPRPYKSDADFPPKRPYDPVWIDLGLLFDSDVLALEIQSNGRDARDYIVVPNGPLRFLATPYQGTEEFFSRAPHRANYAVFGYDWRRPLTEGARFLGEFLSGLRRRAAELGRPDPLPNLTLLAHSQGGLVTKMYLNTLNAADPADWPARFISVATPFYGTWSHAPRYYIGQAPLNTLHGTRRMAKLVGSLPGPYILMFADRATLDRDGGELGLDKHPMLDFATREPVDIYDPANLGRFPDWVSRDFLTAAKSAFDLITAPLTDDLAARVFHVRSGLDQSTPVKLLWAGVNGAKYRPGVDPNPFTAVQGPIGQAGDGTVPFWSARLAGTPKEQVYDLTKADSHADLLESVEVLDIVWSTIQRGRLPERVEGSPEYLGQAAAGANAAVELVEAAKAKEIKRGDPAAMDPQVWRQLMNQVSLG